MKKENWILEGQCRIYALQAIAKKLGKEHPVTKMLGSLAWGRHEWEYGSRANLQAAIILASAMDGVYHTINLWARDNDKKAQNIIITTYQARHVERRRSHD